MKSRSPAPGGKKSAMGGKRSELQDLPPLGSLPDGDRTYFVGGWSTEGSFAPAVTRIASENKPADKDMAAEEPMIRLAKDLEGGAFVNAILQPETVTEYTKTSVVILPGLGLEAAAAAGGAGAEASPMVAEVTHGMFISGLAPNAMAAATKAFNARHPTEAAADGDAADGAAAGDANEELDADGYPIEKPQPKLRYEVTYRNPNAEDDEGEDEELVDEDGNPIVPLTPEEVAAEVESLRQKGSAVTPTEVANFLTNVHGAMKVTESAAVDPQALKDTRHQTAPSPAGGSGFAKPKRPTLYRKGITVVDPSDLVTVQGPITFRGIRPAVTVEPEAVTATRIASALGVATITTLDKSGKPKRKTEEEKAREAEATARLEQESRDAARVEEDRLNTFAMPDRWPTVYVSNLAFASPIAIQGAHVRFYRCHFSGVGFADCVPNTADSNKSFLVTINQYCRVEFCDCTFQQPTHTAVYAFPTSELFIHGCYFSQFPIPTTIDEVLRTAVLPPSVSPFPCTGEGSIAVHADCAKVNISKSHFEGFGNAVVFRGKFEVLGRMGGADGEDEGAGAASPDGEPYGRSAEPNDEGNYSIRLRPTLSTITGNVFLNNASSSVSLIDARRVGVTRCFMNDDACGGYYSVQATGTRCTPQVMHCQLYGRILVGLGARPFLYKNTGKVQVVDKNQKEASYMSPKY